MTTQQTDVAPVLKTLTVQASQQRAFEVFTRDLGRWWPGRDYSIGAADFQTAEMQGEPGGRWFERGIDGSECDWGKVLVWEPPIRVVLSWQIDERWRFDPGLFTEVEVRFIPISPNETRVELEHRNLEAFGEAAGQMRGIFDSEGGWTKLLAHYAERVSVSAG